VLLLITAAMDARCNGLPDRIKERSYELSVRSCSKPGGNFLTAAAVMSSSTTVKPMMHHEFPPPNSLVTSTCMQKKTATKRMGTALGKMAASQSQSTVRADAARSCQW